MQAPTCVAPACCPPHALPCNVMDLYNPLIVSLALASCCCAALLAGPAVLHSFQQRACTATEGAAGTRMRSSAAQHEGSCGVRIAQATSVGAPQHCFVTYSCLFCGRLWCACHYGAFVPHLGVCHSGGLCWLLCGSMSHLNLARAASVSKRACKLHNHIFSVHSLYACVLCRLCHYQGEQACLFWMPFEAVPTLLPWCALPASYCSAPLARTSAAQGIGLKRAWCERQTDPPDGPAATLADSVVGGAQPAPPAAPAPTQLDEVGGAGQPAPEPSGTDSDDAAAPRAPGPTGAHALAAALGDDDNDSVRTRSRAVLRACGHAATWLLLPHRWTLRSPEWRRGQPAWAPFGKHGRQATACACASMLAQSTRPPSSMARMLPHYSSCGVWEQPRHFLQALALQAQLRV